MKTTRIAALVIAGLLLAAGASAPAKAADVSFDFFYSNLSSHGSWMVSSSYGNVWQPREYNADWNPYYDGHWEYTDCGWTWVSDYAWGGVPYHYGTWVRDGRYGWVWVPGYTWGPSWVVFRSDNDYVGWAPVPPDFTIGASFSSYSIDPSFYVFVPSRSFVNDRVRTVIVPRTEVNVIVNRTKIVNNNITIVNNVVVNRGPDVKVIEQRTGRHIEQVPIERVRNVAATSTVTRDDIRVDPARARNRKVAEPARESLAEARAKEGRRDNAGPAAAAPDAQDRSGRGRRGRERDNTAAQTSPIAPAYPPAQTPSDTTNARGRRQRNRPTETSTAPQTQAPQTPETQQGVDEARRARRQRDRDVNGASTTPAPDPQARPRPRPRGGARVAPNENPPQPQPPRVRPERPLPPPEQPRVKPDEPPVDPNTTNARKPVRTSPREKRKASEKPKKDEKPPEEGQK